MAMKPIFQLKPGDKITPLRIIIPPVVKNWQYASECSDIGGGVMPGAVLTIVELGTMPGQQWVKVQLPGRSPPGFLKIPGDVLGSNFRLL